MNFSSDNYGLSHLPLGSVANSTKQYFEWNFKIRIRFLTTINSLSLFYLLQTYPFETAYHNGFRAYTSCQFAVKPCRPTQEIFSCILIFQQEGHPLEHKIYLNPGFTPREVHLQ